MAIDLKKDISLNKKSARAVNKHGINLARDEEKRAKRVNWSLVVIAVLAAAALITKYGIVDVIDSKKEAERNYYETHNQYEMVKWELQDYDKVLLEYRAYSRDWMEKDDTGTYVSVSRGKVLDLIEDKLMSKGIVTDVSVSGDTVRVEMLGMNLSEISKMCSAIEESPFVSYATLQTAVMNEKSADEAENLSGSGRSNADMLSFLMLIKLQPEAKEG